MVSLSFCFVSATKLRLFDLLQSLFSNFLHNFYIEFHSVSDKLDIAFDLKSYKRFIGTYCYQPFLQKPGANISNTAKSSSLPMSI